jgi:asparagine N-glycosylation enzyme membrane subunit Stt3
MKPFTKIAAAFFGIAGLIHIYRIVFPFRVMIGNYDVPGLASIVFFVLAIILCIGLWKESKT